MNAVRRHPEERDLLHAAFRSFDEAAHTLQQSYCALTARVEQMDLELARSNEALRRQLCDNEAMRVHLDGILESLSTGVLVVDDGGTISRSNRCSRSCKSCAPAWAFKAPIRGVTILQSVSRFCRNYLR